MIQRGMMSGVAAVTLVLGGCSFVFVSAPDRMPPAGLHCGARTIAPVVDTVVATLSMAWAFSMFGGSATTCSAGCGIGYFLGVIAMAPVVVHGPSAMYGFHSVGRCRALEVTTASEAAR